MKKIAYYVLCSGVWLKCKVANEVNRGFLEYELRYGTTGLAKPGSWKKELIR
jgi:hypothetical protein